MVLVGKAAKALFPIFHSQVTTQQLNHQVDQIRDELKFLFHISGNEKSRH